MSLCVCLTWLLLTVCSHSADTNNDRFLDPIELEALFFKEVKDIYGDDRDQTEIREEMARMREHVLEEVSTAGACVFDYRDVQRSEYIGQSFIRSEYIMWEYCIHIGQSTQGQSMQSEYTCTYRGM